MTKKRFTLIEDMDFDIEYIKDSNTFKSISDLDSCCDMLNSLNDENEQLKQQLTDILELTKKIEDYTHDIKMIGDVE